jgi:glycerol uptake facilitator-like aquaporin
MLGPGLDSARLVAIAIAHGLAIALLAAATGAISGGHINPAVTLAFVVAGKENLIRASLYVAAQLLGAIFGAALLDLSTPGGLTRWLRKRLRGVSDPDSRAHEREGSSKLTTYGPQEAFFIKDPSTKDQESGLHVGLSSRANGFCSQGMHLKENASPRPRGGCF